jgi:TusA-related sulfurtransferase
MPDVVDYYLDITTEVCPLTFVRTKLLIERMNPGDTAEVRLKGNEPLENVPRSVEEMGHAVLELVPEPGSQGPDRIYLLRLRKN